MAWATCLQQASMLPSILLKCNVYCTHYYSPIYLFMKKIALVIILFACTLANAQENKTKGLQTEVKGKTIQKDASDTATKTWKKGGIFGLNVSQAALSNWAAGGDDFSLALNMAVNGYAFYKKGKHSWDNTIAFNLGYVNTTSLGSRKNDDRLDFLSKYGYELHPKLNLSTLFNFRTQLFDGYTYPTATTKTFSSTFLSPAYVLLGVGLDWKPVKGLSIFFSPLTARVTIVNNDSLSAQGLYGVDPGKKSKFQLGAFSNITYAANINQNLTYTGRLDLFSDYLDKPQNIAVNMNNLFAVKISKALSATWSLDLIYDDNVKLFGVNKDAPRLQLKSMVGAGLLVKL